MQIEQILDLIDNASFVSIGKHLGPLELIVLKGALKELTYEQIAAETHYSEAYLKRDVGPKLWKMLSKVLGESVSKKNIKTVIEYQSAYSSPFNQHEDKVSLVENSESYQDWGEAPSITDFYGRQDELEQLSEWLNSSNMRPHRIIGILGMGGVGKSALATKLAQALQLQFRSVIWRSLLNAPKLAAFLEDVLAVLSIQSQPGCEVRQLLNAVKAGRILLILDNLETILDPQRPGQFLPGYQGYGTLLKIIGEASHRSCIIFTSREKPWAIYALEGEHEPIGSLFLSGQTEIGMALLKRYRVIGSPEQKKKLCDHYSANPLALKIAATTIDTLFKGDLSDFLAQETLFFNSIRELLDEQLQRLTALEKDLMYWLAIHREWVNIDEISESLMPRVSTRELLESLESLIGRSLIELESGYYSQQPVVMEYVIQLLIDQLVEEVRTEQFQLFSSHSLVQVTAKDYIRKIQIQFILDPLATKLIAIGAEHWLQQHLKPLLEQLRKHGAIPSYTVGNLINLLSQLQINLAGYDFSGLFICHADLRRVNLHRSSFQNAVFSKCTFAESLGEILTMTFSPVGNWIATGDVDGFIRLWSTIRNIQTSSINAHQGRIWTIAISPDARTIISSGEDATVRMWRANDGQLIHTLPLEKYEARSLAISPDGKKLAIGCTDSNIRLLDLQSQQFIREFNGHTDEVWAVHFDPAGLKLISGGLDRDLRLWQVSDGTCLQNISGHRHRVEATRFNVDGSMIASASKDQTLRIWEVHTDECLFPLQGHTHSVHSVDFSPDGRIVASSSSDSSVRLWDVSTGKLQQILLGHTNSVRTVCFSPHGLSLASGGMDATIKFWDVHTGSCFKSVQGYRCTVKSVRWSSRLIATAGDDWLVHLRDTKTGKILHTLRKHTNSVNSLCFSPDGQILATGGADHNIHIWDVTSGEWISTLHGHPYTIHSIQFSPNGFILAGANHDHTIQLWDLRSDEILNSLKGHSDGVRCLAFRPDSQQLASGSDDHTIRLWDLETGTIQNILEGHNYCVSSVSYDPKGDILVSGSHDWTLRMWDIHTGECLKILEGHRGEINEVRFNSLGDILASCSHDQTIRLWDVQKRENFRIFRGHNGAIHSLDFSPDGKLLLTSSQDETLRFWDINTGECIKVLSISKLYAGMDITGATGLSIPQKRKLKEFGAVEQEVVYS